MAGMAIWSKGDDQTDALVHAFTVGDDYLHDRDLAPFDLIGSLAHARMLGSVGLLDATDASMMRSGLIALHREFLNGEWTIDAKDEDVHSKIESLLTSRIGEAGKRLHTGRSRNDQVLTAIRLWQRHTLCRQAMETVTLIRALLERAHLYEFHPFPGYTHQQRAMPSSLGQFFGGHAQALADDLTVCEAAWELTGSCPLGSGAGYGVGLPLDRALSAQLLGFTSDIGISMADANARGKVETACLDAGGAVFGDLSRFACDMLFFTTSECGFFTLGAGFTTGSSIMPQKKNLDLFELVRARASKHLGMRTALVSMTLGLTSGYARDLQDTKALCLDGMRLVRSALAVVAAAVPTIEPVEERIVAALTPDIYATDEAYRLVREQGLAFRDAYKQVGTQLHRLQVPNHEQVVRNRTHLGSTGKLGLVKLGERVQRLHHSWDGRLQRLESTWQALLSQ